MVICFFFGYGDWLGMLGLYLLVTWSCVLNIKGVIGFVMHGGFIYWYAYLFLFNPFYNCTFFVKMKLYVAVL